DIPERLSGAAEMDTPARTRASEPDWKCSSDADGAAGGGWRPLINGVCQCRNVVDRTVVRTLAGIRNPAIAWGTAGPSRPPGSNRKCDHRSRGRDCGYRGAEPDAYDPDCRHACRSAAPRRSAGRLANRRAG